MFRSLAAITLAFAGLTFFSSASFASEELVISGVDQGSISQQDEIVVSAAMNSYSLDRVAAVRLWSGVSQFSDDCNLAIATNPNVINCEWDTNGSNGFATWIFRELHSVDRAWLESRPYQSRVAIKAESIERADLEFASNNLAARVASTFADISFNAFPDYSSSSVTLEIGTSSLENSSEAFVEDAPLDNEALQDLIDFFTLETGIAVSVNLQVLPSSGPLNNLESYQGGLAMVDLGCTGGFVVQDSLGRTGISTARHCVENTDSIAYAGNLYTSDWTVLDYASGDIAYAVVSGTAIPQFQSSLGIFTAVTGFKNPAIGEIVCHFGVASNQKCAKVTRINVSSRFSDPVYSVGGATYPLVGGLWVTSGNVSAPGDSGGPWFIGGILAGIHAGKITVNGAQYSVFTRYGAINLLSAWGYGTR